MLGECPPCAFVPPRELAGRLAGWQREANNIKTRVPRMKGGSQVAMFATQRKASLILLQKGVLF